MKNIIIVFTILSVISACSKEPKIKLKNITQTDENCNVIGEPAPGQWSISNLSNLNERDQLIIFGNNEDQSNFKNLLVNTLNIDLDSYKFDCPVDFNFNFLVCPNPVNINSTPDGKLFQNFESDLEIRYYIFSAVNRQNGMVSSTWGTNQIGSSSMGGDSFYPNYGRDHTRYYLIFTADSCAFFGKGDIIFKK